MICSSENRFFTSNLRRLGNWTPNRRATQNRGDVAGTRALLAGRGTDVAAMAAGQTTGAEEAAAQMRRRLKAAVYRGNRTEPCLGLTTSCSIPAATAKP